MSELWTPERRKLAMDCCWKWHGTPHVNRLAEPGVGIDCVKLVHEILAAAGIVEWQAFGGYDTQDGMHGVSYRLCHAFEHALHVERMSPHCQPEFGMLAIFRTGDHAGHCGFLDGVEFWHSLAGAQVTHSPYTLWRHRMFCLYRLTALGWKGSVQEAVKL